MNDETSNRNEPIGLYRHPESGAYIGALDAAQANAYVHHGFKLVEQGVDAARMTEVEIEQMFGTPDHELETANDRGSNRKGK